MIFPIGQGNYWTQLILNKLMEFIKLIKIIMKKLLKIIRKSF